MTPVRPWVLTVTLLLFAGCSGGGNDELDADREPDAADSTTTENSRTATPIPTPDDTAEPATAEFDFGAGVSAEDEAAIRDGLRQAEQFVSEMIGRQVTGRFTVSAEASAEPPTANADLAAITFHTLTPVWLAKDAAQRRRIAGHEYFHLIQFEAGWLGPAWLFEGAAEYMSFLPLINDGTIDSAGLQQLQEAIAASVGLGLDELAQDFGSAETHYSLGALAVESLVGASGPAALARYMDLLEEGARWPEAFSSAFGVELESFYRAFASERGRLPAAER